MTIHNETDLLGLTRAEKKLAYWKELHGKGTTEVLSKEDGIIYDVEGRIEYWTKQVEKYKKRIHKHLEEFKKVNDFWAFTRWISGIVQTIKDIINSLTN